MSLLHFPSLTLEQQYLEKASRTLHVNSIDLRESEWAEDRVFEKPFPSITALRWGRESEAVAWPVHMSGCQQTQVWTSYIGQTYRSTILCLGLQDQVQLHYRVRPNIWGMLFISVAGDCQRSSIFHLDWGFLQLLSSLQKKMTGKLSSLLLALGLLQLDWLLLWKCTQ